MFGLGNDAPLLVPSLGFVLEVDSIFAASDIVVLSYGADYNKGFAVLLQAAAYLRPLLVSGPGYLENFVKAYSIGESFAASDPQDFFSEALPVDSKIRARSGVLSGGLC